MRVGTATESRRWLPVTRERVPGWLPSSKSQRFNMPRMPKSRLKYARAKHLCSSMAQIIVPAFIVVIVLDTMRAHHFEPVADIMLGLGNIPAQQKTQLSQPIANAHNDSVALTSTIAEVPAAIDTSGATDEHESSRAEKVDESQKIAEAPESKAVSATAKNPWEALPRRADWESQEPPAWCEQLKREPRPSAAAPGMPVEKKRCGRRKDNGECYDGTPITFFSQHHQGKQQISDESTIIS